VLVQEEAGSNCNAWIQFSVEEWLMFLWYTNGVTATNSPLRFHWNIGPQQLSVAEVSVEFTFFIETGLLALCSNPQPGGPGLHIYILWRLSGPVIPQPLSTHFSRLLRHAWATVGLFFSPVTTQGVIHTVSCKLKLTWTSKWRVFFCHFYINYHINLTYRYICVNWTSGL
jgi:hypothetical protein